MKVQEIPTRTVSRCDPTSGGTVADGLMRTGDRGTLAAGGDEKQTTEIVTDWDLSPAPDNGNGYNGDSRSVVLANLRAPVGEILERKGREVWSVAGRAPVYEAILRMSQARVGALLVIDKGKLAGIVSEQDYARKVALKSKLATDTTVREVMTTPVITVPPSATVIECLRLMIIQSIGHLPVFSGPTLVGVISMGDLVESIVFADEFAEAS